MSHVVENPNLNPVAEALRGSWGVSPWIPSLALLTFLVYARGWWKLHQRRRDVFGFRHLLCFLAGATLLFVAIASPLHELGEISLMAHMIQHVLLMMVIPPVILLGAPHLVLLFGLPDAMLHGLLRPFLGWTPLKKLVLILFHPVNCWLAFVGTTLAWHTPVMFELALRSELWHAVEHICFLVTAFLFWWPVVQPWPSRARWSRWAMIPYLLLADLQNTALSAFLIFCDRVVYPTYATAPRIFGMSALEDQAAAGAIMWVPGSCAFLIPLTFISIRLMSPSRGAVGPSDPSPFSQRSLDCLSTTADPLASPVQRMLRTVGTFAVSRFATIVLRAVFLQSCVNNLVVFCGKQYFRHHRAFGTRVALSLRPGEGDERDE